MNWRSVDTMRGMPPLPMPWKKEIALNCVECTGDIKTMTRTAYMPIAIRASSELKSRRKKPGKINKTRAVSVARAVPIRVPFTIASRIRWYLAAPKLKPMMGSRPWEMPTTGIKANS